MSGIWLEFLHCLHQLLQRVSKAAILFLVLLLFLGLAVIDHSYLPAMNGSLFPVDDNALVEAPQVLTRIDREGIKTLFTPGTNLDFYPMRDLSYLLDYQVFGKDWSKWKVHNLLLFNELILLVVLSLGLLGVPFVYAIAFALIWGAHPMHAEMVSWLSARKDLLAMVYSSYSFVFLLLGIKFAQHSRFLRPVAFTTSFLFFIASCLSKATFPLLPILFLPVIYFWRAILGTLRNLLWVAAFLAVGLSSAVFQSWYYSHVTPMVFPYPMDYRLESALAAFAKSWGGLIFPSWNVVNIETYGDWLANNQHLVIPGAILFSVALLLAGLAIRKKNRFLAIPLLGFFLLYLPTSGLFFPHRSFYSVRYFEAPFLVFFIALTSGAFKHMGESWDRLRATRAFLTVTPAVLIFAILLVTLLRGLQQEASVWASPVNVYNKALLNEPKSILLKSLMYTSLIQEYRRTSPSTDISPEQQGQIFHALDSLGNELRRACTEERNLPNCLNFLAQQNTLVVTDQTGDRQPSSEILAHKMILEHYKMALKVTRPGENWDQYYDVMADLKSDTHLDKLRAKMQDWRTQNAEMFLRTSNPRMLYGLSECLISGQDASREIFRTFVKRHLLNPGDFDGFMKTSVHPNLRPQLGGCYLER